MSVVVYNLRTLFLALAEDKDLRLTAFRCKTSQRMIRASVAQLEAEQGVQLCVFEKHHVFLTEAGENFRQANLSRNDKETITRLLAIMQDHASKHKIPQWMNRIADRSWPFLQLGPPKTDATEQVNCLLLGTIDLLLVYGWPRVDRGRLRFEHLYGQKLAAFVTERECSLGQESVSLASIHHAKLIVPSSSVMPGIDDLISWESRKTGTSPNVIPSHSRSHFFDQVRSGIAVGIAPSKLFSRLPRGIEMLPLIPTITIPVGCLHRADVSASSIKDLLRITSDLADAERKEVGKKIGQQSSRKVDKPATAAFREILDSFMLTSRV